MQEAESPEPVVDSHQDDVAVAGEAGAVVPGGGAGAGEPATTVYPDHHRAVAVVEAGRPHVEVEGVLALLHVAGTEHLLQGRVALGGDRGEASGVADLVPRPLAKGSVPTEGPYGWLRVGDAPEDVQAVLLGALDLAAAGLRDRHLVPSGRSGRRTRLLLQRGA